LEDSIQTTLNFKTKFSETSFSNVSRYGRKAENAYGLEIKIMFLKLSYGICNICLLGMVFLN